MNQGTGIVTSVPSDSPDDFAAFRDLKVKQPFRYVSRGLLYGECLVSSFFYLKAYWLQWQASQLKIVTSVVHMTTVWT